MAMAFRKALLLKYKETIEKERAEKFMSPSHAAIDVDYDIEKFAMTGELVKSPKKA